MNKLSIIRPTTFPSGEIKSADSTTLVDQIVHSKEPMIGHKPSRECKLICQDFVTMCLLLQDSTAPSSGKSIEATIYCKGVGSVMFRLVHNAVT